MRPPYSEPCPDQFHNRDGLCYKDPSNVPHCELTTSISQTVGGKENGWTFPPPAWARHTDSVCYGCTSNCSSVPECMDTKVHEDASKCS